MSRRELVHEEPLMVRMDPGLKRRLKITAAQQGTDMNRMARTAISEYLDKIDRATAKATARSGSRRRTPQPD
jgi:predicted transcriptional regulator